MENKKEYEENNLVKNNSTEEFPDPEIGVQHDENGNIIKIAENAVPPKAWENQKKAYSDAFENNKNQQLEDDF